jgi:hypothetical protein
MTRVLWWWRNLQNILIYIDRLTPNYRLLYSRDVSDVKPQSTQDFVDSLISRQSKLIDAAIQSQTEINEDNLRERYASYARLHKLRQRIQSDVDYHSVSTEPMPISFILATKRKPKPPIFLCHEMDSSTGVSVFGGTGIYQTTTIRRGDYRYNWWNWC